MIELFDQRRYLIPFRSSLLPQIFTDTLVIGAGVAGLRAAIEASTHGDVIVLAKGSRSNTKWAQGGIASVMFEDDSFDSHAEDTMVAGAGLCDESTVRLVVERGPSCIRDLVEYGMRFDRSPSGDLARGREGGHDAARIYHTDGDGTGREMARCLHEALRGAERARLFDNCFALDLITPTPEAGSPVMGAITFHKRYGLQMIWARSTILASGGAGMLYRETTNPPLATGDGIAMAYRAGATVGDMAFMQFHPTALYLPGAPRALISEAVRGEGAHLLDAGGHRFMPDVHERAELAPRDVVSRAIVRQIARQGGQHVHLDCRHIEGFATRFPGIADVLGRFGLDAQTDLIPVHPAAHYTIGGVRTDHQGRTNIPGLFAVGEVACTGLHGANRLASNSLLEGLVFGEIAGEVAGLESGNVGPVPVVSDIRPSDGGEIDLEDITSSLRSAMWRNVGVERTGSKLDDASQMIDFLARYTLDKIFDHPAGWETQNLLLLGALVTRSALWRTESRGCHRRLDFEEPDDALRVHDHWGRHRNDAETVAI